MNPNFSKQEELQTNDPYGASSAGEQDFSFTEEKKPMNRNAVVLLLIIALGGGLVYFMYMRSNVEVTQDASTAEASQKIDTFITEGKQNMIKVEAMLQNTQKVVEVFNQKGSEGQIPTSSLKTNPFAFEEKSAGQPKGAAPAAPLDPSELARAALAKAQLQTILYSQTGTSSCIISNRVCSEGQKVKIGEVDFQVETITPTSVTLKNASGSYPLELKGNNALSR